MNKLNLKLKFLAKTMLQKRQDQKTRTLSYRQKRTILKRFKLVIQ